jgi:hypothetical protein
MIDLEMVETHSIFTPREIPSMLSLSSRADQQQAICSRSCGDTPAQVLVPGGSVVLPFVSQTRGRRRAWWVDDGVCVFAAHYMELS